MQNVDLKYLSRNIANLCGIPIRIYENGEPVFFYSNLNFRKDPILPIEKEVLSNHEHVGYHIAKDFSYYGIVNHGNTKIILGPSRTSPFHDQDAYDMAFHLNLGKEEIEDFVSSVKCIVPMPLDSMLESLCCLNYILNGETLTLEDITFPKDRKAMLEENREKKKSEEVFSNAYQDQAIHNTMSIENALCHIVSHGDTPALDEWLSKAPPVRGGILAKEELRQIKNTFIVSVTLISRAAIKGGMDINEALQMSDRYIQEMELLHDREKITDLQYSMVKDYTREVAKLKGKEDSTLALTIRNYIHQHMSEPIDIERLSKSLFFSRTYLANRFKKETGMTLSEFLLREKIEEGKRLLRYSDKPISVISLYLGFSSQSHFSNVFRKYTGMSPLDYKKRHE